MDKIQLLNILENRLEGSVSRDRISEFLESIDLENEINKVKSEYSISIWDKVSNINNAPASYVLNQAPHNIPGWNGLTYLISKDDKVLYMQHDDFREQGWQPITSEAMAFELADIQLRPSLEEAVVAVAISKLRGE